MSWEHGEVEEEGATEVKEGVVIGAEQNCVLGVEEKE